MNRIREEFDGDSERSSWGETVSDELRFETVCSGCGRTVFTDRAEHEKILHALELDADNQFVCDRCVDANYEAAELTR